MYTIFFYAACQIEGTCIGLDEHNVNNIRYANGKALIANSENIHAIVNIVKKKSSQANECKEAQNNADI